MTNTKITNGFYIPPSRQQFLNTVQELSSKTGIVAMEGAVGIGKTTMLEELLTSALPNANKCYITVVSSINDIQVRSRIIEQLFGNVLFDPEKPMLNAFLEFGGSDEIMLAVDNGHNLSGQIIGEILQVVAEFKKLNRIISVLVSFDKQQSNTIGSITSALISVIPVPKFSYKESYTLINQSFDGVPSSDNVKVRRWIENAQGNPIQLLAFNTNDALRISTPGAMNVKLWGSSLVLISLILALSVYFYRQFYAIEKPAPKTISEKAIKPVTPPVVSDWSSAKVKEHVVKVKQEQLLDINVASNTDILTALTNSLEPANVKPAEVQSEVVESELVSEIDSQPAPIEQALTQPTEPAPIQPTLIQPTESTLINSNAINEFEPLKVAGYEVNNEQMMLIKPNKFVLQLTAVSQESTLETYLKDKRLDTELTRIYKISRNNSDWLVVTYGIFDTIASARETAKKVDPNAWAKSVEAIQQQIKSYNESLSQ
ncbi:hypothetical protein N9L48_04220 [Psychrosphaera sp.]|nr:hypothetical protein [Psychrosphaera sp.]